MRPLFRVERIPTGCSCDRGEDQERTQHHSPTLRRVECPWPQPTCILCLREAEKLSRAHLFAEMLGGFLWSRTHCRECNSYLGSEVEAAAKRDDSFRHAIERELAAELPDLADSFAEGQNYIARAADGSLVRGARRGGEARIVASTSKDGVLSQSEEEARKGIEKRLRRAGTPEDDIAAALGRFDSALEGVLTEIDGMAGVRAALIAHDPIRAFGEHVDKLSFPLVAPLSAADDDCS